MTIKNLFQSNEFDHFIEMGRNLYLGFYKNKLKSISGNYSLISAKLEESFEQIFHKIPDILNKKSKCIDEQLCFITTEVAGRVLEVSIFTKTDYLFLHLNDITDFRRIEDHLRESEDRFRTLCDFTYEAVAIVLDGKIIDCNQSLGNLLSVPTYELLGQQFTRFIEKSNQSEIKSYIQNPDNKSLETCLLTGKSELLSAEINIRVMRSEKKDVRVISLRDITERLANEAEINLQNQRLQESYEDLKNIQNQLIEVEKIASLGTMAAGIAHEISQPLNALKITIDGMEFWFQKGRKQSPENIRRKLLKVAEHANRITEIVNSIRSIYQEGQAMKLCTVNLVDCLKKALQILKTDPVNYELRVEYSIEDHLPTVMAHPIYMEQIFLNIIRNASNALQGQHNGIVKVTAKRTQKIVEISIEDNGPGLGDQPSKVFDPFFSLDQKNQGMGLGLALVRTTVMAWNGKITAHNRSELFNPELDGSIFIIELPIAGEVS